MRANFNQAFLALVLWCPLPSATGADSSSTTHIFRPLTAPGVENFFAVSSRVYSGSSPEGEAAFAALAKLGIKTIISVDGAKPDVQTAARHGIRYVHLPFGYDGVPATNAAQLVKAATAFPGPIFVHCHHGLHRGPAAVAIICKGTEGWSPGLAMNWLHTAGTSTNYSGLYQTVAEFRPPTAEELRKMPATFPARAKTTGLVDTMVKIDEHFDALRAIRKAEFRTPPNQPDLSPVNESLLLWELFREAQRTKLGASRGAKFLAEMARAEIAASDLHVRLKELATENTTAQRDSSKAAFQAMTRSCASCHKTFRN